MTIERIDKLINEHYVYPEIAKKTGDHLKKKLAEGYFNNVETMEAFASSLTTEVQSINHDKHMRIRVAPSRQAAGNGQVNWIDELIERADANRGDVAGFIEAKKLEGNIGYVNFRYFAGMAEGAPVVDTYMKLLSTSDAIIIDLRKNGGGNPVMVQYLCSYFFQNPVHLNSLYWRKNDRTEDFWSLEKVNGKKLPDVPLFVLTSHRTFSGAEEFSYNMQTQNRATLVGETTGGGANPGQGMPINENLGIFIPTGRAINPVTKTNWEGTGVVPTVKINSDSAFNKSLELARVASAAYRDKKNIAFKSLLQELQSNFDLINKGSNEKIEKQVYLNLKKATDLDFLHENAINELGYNFMQKNQIEIAEVILKSNTELFPNSANTYDSYGEALSLNGKLNQSMASYQKAVDLATRQNDPRLVDFKEGLEKIKAKVTGNK